MTFSRMSGYVALAFALGIGGGALTASLGTPHRRRCALISLGQGCAASHLN